MENVRTVFNKVTSSKALVNSSLYVQKDDKLMRFADHKCNWKNIDLYNEGVKEVLLVFVSPNIDELEIQDNIENIQDNLDVYVDYVIYEDESDLDLVQLKVDRFFK